MKLSGVILQSGGKILLISGASFLMICIGYVFAGKIVERQIQANAETSLNTTEFVITSGLRERKSLLFSASVFIQKMLREGGTPEELQSCLGELRDEFLRESGVDNPRYIYGYFREKLISGTSRDFPQSFYVQRRPWFEAALSGPDEIKVTQPYVDIGTGKFVISLVQRVGGVENENFGVLAMDIGLDELSESIARFSLGEGGYGLVLAPDLMFITHFNKEKIGDYLWNMGPTQARVAEALKKGIDSIVRFESTDSAEHDIISFFKRMSNGWYACTTIPRRAYYRDVRMMASILGIAGFMLIGAVSYFVIRLNMAKSKAEEESATKTKFLARMSHEIRTPLNSIIGMAEILIRKINAKNTRHEIHEYVSIIQQSGMSLLAIINDILDVSKIESGSLLLNESKYSFSSLINDVINIASVQIVDHKAIDFIVHADVDIPHELIGDEVRVRQILVNLLSNAIKYTNYGFIMLDVKLERRNQDTVTFFANSEKIVLSLTVRDTGVGIREKDQKRIFSEFTRVDSRLNQKIEGTGLGLAIVQNLCRLMGGDVRMTSVYGSGSEFTATIRQKAGSSKKLASLADPGQKRVLFFKEAEARHLSIMSAMKELGVPEPKLVERRCDFIKEFVTGLHDYAFISSQYALRCFRECEQQCLEVCQEENPRTRLVVMAAFGDATAIPGASGIAMPVYCVPLANALNGASSSEHRVRDANGLPLFSAPEATVLVVDDVLTNLRVAREFMEYYGIAVETCMDGVEALEMVEDRRYDLIFMDHMMPKMNGLEATLRIRRLGGDDEYFRNVPIVVLTANAVVGQREIFLEHGFNDFLPKPLEAQALDAVLRKWLPPEKQRAAEAVHIDGGAAPNVRQGTVEGLDVEKGIKNVGGRQSAYAGVLSVFRQDCETLMPRLLTALAEGDLSAYAITAHALKGSLRTIGAERLAFSAMRLENAASSGDAGFLKEETQSFLDELQTLTGAFDLVLPGLGGGEAAGNSGDAAGNGALSRKLDELRQALISMDVQAVNDLLAECLGMELSSGQRTLVDEIDMLVMAFEFEEAVAKIDNFVCFDMSSASG